jgi:hypothetical protein
MSASSKTTIGASFNQSGSGLFLDNTTREISPADLRAFVDAVLQSYPNILDNAYDGLKGLKPGISTIAGLKAITTVSQSTGIFVTFRDVDNNNALRTYELIAGVGTSPADDETSPIQIKPTDYTSVTPKIWKLARVDSMSSFDMSDNFFPANSIQWQRFYGTKSGSSALLDKAGNPLPDEIIATAKIDNASTTDPNDWIFENTIF